MPTRPEQIAGQLLLKNLEESLRETMGFQLPRRKNPSRRKSQLGPAEIQTTGIVEAMRLEVEADDVGSESLAASSATRLMAHPKQISFPGGQLLFCRRSHP